VLIQNGNQKTGWLLTRVWLNALEETARDFHGTLPKEFCMRAYEHATDTWIKLLDDEYGILIPRTDSLLQAVKNYIEAGVAGGIFESIDEFELQEIPSGGIKVTVHRCAYQDSCRYLLTNKGYSLKTLTCARIGCFKAAGTLLSNVEATYHVNKIEPGISCEGEIVPV